MKHQRWLVTITAPEQCAGRQFIMYEEPPLSPAKAAEIGLPLNAACTWQPAGHWIDGRIEGDETVVVRVEESWGR